MQKPFNPILGETYQASMGKYEVALEQISHHPPISCYQVWSEKHSKWQIHGYMEYRPVITLTSAGGHGYGPLTVEFEDGHSIEIWSPHTEIKGIMMGERTYNFYGSLHVKDKKNNLFCEIVFNIDRKGALKSLLSYGASFLPGKSNGTAELNQSQRGDYFEGVISNSENLDYAKTRKSLTKGVDYIADV